MKLFLKLASITFALLFVSVVLAIAIIDPNDYKQEIQEQVKNKLNRDLLIAGDIGWSFYPVLGFASGEVILKNSPEFEETTLVTIKEAAVSINILPLITGKLEIGEVILDGAEFNLITNKDGLSNLDNLHPVDAVNPTETVKNTTPTEDKVEEKTSESSSNTYLSQLALSGITITNAQFQISDHQKGEYQQIAIQRLILDEFAFDQQSHFSLTTLIKNQQVEAEISIDTDLLIDSDLNQLTLSDLIIESKVLSQALPDTTINTSFKTGLIYQIKNKQLNIKTIALNTLFSGDFLTGELDLKINDMLVLDDNDLSIEAFTLTGNLNGTSLENNQLNTSLKTNLTANVKKQTARIGQFELNNTLNGEALEGELNLSFKELNVTDFANIVIQKFKLDAELDAPAIHKNKINTKIETDISYDLNAQQLNITSLQSKLNQLHLDGELSFKQQAIPVIRYTLKGNVWDLNPYLPEKTETSETEQEAVTPVVAQTEETTEQVEPDLSILKQLDIRGDFSLDGLLYEDIKVGKITNKLIVKDGQASIKPLTINLYDGSLYLDAWVNEANGKNKYQATIKIKDLTLLPLLKDAAKLEILSGKANFDLVANGQGLTATKIQQGVNAKGSFKILDGEVYGINLSEKVRVFKAKLKGQTLPEDKRVKKTDFASLSGDFTVAKGIVNNQKLLMLSPVIRLDGTGTANTIKQTLDYKLGITPLSKTTEETSYADLGGISIPLLISGPFADPSIKLDTESALKSELEAKKQALKDKAAAELKRQQEKLKEKSADEIKDKLKDQLKKFF
ncbi:AsmA family protein [Psychromonas algicola]|uniref:AsmA family protein n=1 Tax=Psychromonas algicola TaxID=2555642 RepID=UPI0010676FDA|nr:AsmA family protein [Psychromonas sp. RZ5]TEW52486.1 AsmA family protein [Psychromonas sp. RZ5]